MRKREIHRAESCSKRHGRLEHRRIAATTLDGWTDWPGLRQVCRIDRTRTILGKESRETTYAITNLSRATADAAELLKIAVGHWAIENSLHYVRDVSMGEDACRVRSGSAPQILASFRNVSLLLMRRAGAGNIAAAQRRYAAMPEQALALILRPPSRQN